MWNSTDITTQSGSATVPGRAEAGETVSSRMVAGDAAHTASRQDSSD